MDKEELKILIAQGKSLYEIAEHYDKGYSTIRYWVEKYNLKTNFKRPNTCKDITDNDIQEAVKLSETYAQALTFLKIHPNTSRYKWLKEKIIKLNLDTSHFLSRTEYYNKYERDRKTRDYSVLESDRTIRFNCTTLTNFLNFHNIECKCNKCGLKEWLGEELRLDIDHIDSNPLNNTLENLQYLCPNCHRQETQRRIPRKKNTYSCRNCGKERKSKPKSKDCKFCAPRKRTKIQWPTKEEMKELVWKFPRTELANQLGVRDNTIKKFCKKNNIEMPSRGYWRNKKWKI